jgi:hypothetical protein
LLTDKALGFQIVLFTCGPGDYLAANAMPSKAKGAYKHADGGL